ncbi:MAG TPA: hypothetical protein VFW50_38500 [Streptosporangiaceae bacterium]|nr:hypothetical protein [Streptosporangiaceae bacterium]
MRLHGKDYSAAWLARMAGDLAAAGGTPGSTWLAAGESRAYSTTFRIIDQSA